MGFAAKSGQSRDDQPGRVCGMFNLYSGVGIMFSAVSCLKLIGDE